MEHLVIDCSGSIGQEQVARLYEEAVQAARHGDMDRAGNLARQADRAALDMKPGPTERRVPFTEADYAQQAKDAEEGARQRVAFWRAQRNGLLAASDWTTLPDVPLDPVKRAAWAAYRQYLRDMTFDSEPVWPVAP